MQTIMNSLTLAVLIAVVVNVQAAGSKLKCFPVHSVSAVKREILFDCNSTF